MNKGFYTKLAWTGIKKNKQLYYPYLLAGAAMVMVFYIFSFLGESQVVKSLPGKEVLPFLFHYGAWAVGLFSVPFLFYANASLIKKRKRELGLYNILGMNKKNIFQILFQEAFLTYCIAVFGGVFAGIVFSKIAELGLVNIMDKEVNYRIYVEWKSVIYSLGMFAVVFILILISMMYQVGKNNPIELLHSESSGERPPKRRFLPTVLSFVFLVIGYVIAAGIKMPISFFKLLLAAGSITLGSFLLFICASVYLCKILQNNKGYYYKTSHFVTVSTMSFRMKRNGASLAAICVLVTFILVSLTFSMSFYKGSVDVVDSHYPNDMGVRLEIPGERVKEEIINGSYTKEYRLGIEKALAEKKVSGLESMQFYSANMLAVIRKGCLDFGIDMRDTWFTPGGYGEWERGEDKIVNVRVIFLDTYNKICNTSFTLQEGEVFTASREIAYSSDSVRLKNGKEAKVKSVERKTPGLAEARILGDSMDAHGCEEMFLVVPDLNGFIENGESIERFTRENYLNYQWECGISMEKNEAAQQAVYEAVSQSMDRVCKALDSQYDGEDICYWKVAKGERFYALAGGLLFLAVIMNILFVFVVALIMYYKQISEGYEDVRRFEIMGKIGMTAGEMKNSVRSQMLTVFALPLLAAGVHMVFTYNIPYRMLRMAVIDDRGLVIKVMWICYFIFGAVYTLVYGITSRVYYNIVKNPEEK
ncbi:MAG: ABC transporter permease [Lachnospiraceae bacterium]|nr:ABC transporter permease [Lachnospiraceae bacterium]